MVLDARQIGYYIRNKREFMNLTQRGLGSLLNVSPQTVSKWERGVGIPDIFSLMMLAQTFNVTVDDLLNSGSSIQNLNFSDDNTYEIKQEITTCHDCSIILSKPSRIEDYIQSKIFKFVFSSVIIIMLITVWSMATLASSQEKERIYEIKKSIEFFSNHLEASTLRMEALMLAKIEYFYEHDIDSSDIHTIYSDVAANDYFQVQLDYGETEWFYTHIQYSNYEFPKELEFTLKLVYLEYMIFHRYVSTGLPSGINSQVFFTELYPRNIRGYIEEMRNFYN